MIYLHEPGLLFLKPHKVAGSSFEIALSHFAKEGDIVTVLKGDEDTRAAAGGKGPQGHLFLNSELDNATPLDWRRAQLTGDALQKFYPHISAYLARERLGAERFDAATKVSIVRDPFEKAVSTYYWRMRFPGERKSFEHWCLEWAGELDRDNCIYMIDDLVVIDRMLRFEHLDADIAALERDFPSLTGLSEIFARSRAKTGVRPPKDDFAKLSAGKPALRRLIEKRCWFELEHCGYASQ